MPPESKILLLEARKVNPKEISLRWSDHHEAVYSAAHLRRNCPCAYCVNEITGERLLSPEEIPEDLQIEKISPVGRYALSFLFSDGHSTGIYPYTLLRSLCPCKEH